VVFPLSSAIIIIISNISILLHWILCTPLCLCCCLGCMQGRALALVPMSRPPFATLFFPAAIHREIQTVDTYIFQLNGPVSISLTAWKQTYLHSLMAKYHSNRFSGQKKQFPSFTKKGLKRKGKSLSVDVDLC
jgi:hypothetical protein